MKYTWQNRADKCIAQGSLTNSKRLACLIKGVYPSHLKEAHGAFVYDTDGRKYIDMICGLGSTLLGYGNDQITKAAMDKAFKGTSLPLASTTEVEFAEKLKELFLFIDCVKIFKSGSEACVSALKIARSYTNRKLVLTDGYHGHIDELASLAPPAFGCVGGAYIARLTRLDQITKEVAAVIIEPVICEYSKERIEYLKSLREVCTENGVVLIFDEIITGLRFPKYSVSALTGVEPDLVCLGKAIANGFPLGVVGGRYKIMNDKEYFVSGTFNGDQVALAAGLETLKLMQTRFDINRLWSDGADFVEKFNMDKLITLEAYPTRGRWIGDDLNKALFMQECCKAGILINPSWFWSFPLMDHKDLILHTTREIKRRIRQGTVKLEGEMPQTPFAMRMRNA